MRNVYLQNKNSKNMKKAPLFIVLLSCVLTSFMTEAYAQKITGKYWIYSNVSSLNSDEAGFLDKVNESFNGTKIFFDAGGEFEIYLPDGKSFTYDYEWDAKSQKLAVSFADKEVKNQHIQFLEYYQFKCRLAGDSYLELVFYAPTSPESESDDVTPAFSMFFKVK